MRRIPAGIVGTRSYVEDTDTLFKPRPTTPHVVIGEMQYMTVQGMLAAGYTNLFRDIGGFNPRRRFWGEWTEFNLRMWRHGFPGGYVMNGGFLPRGTGAGVAHPFTGGGRGCLWG